MRKVSAIMMLCITTCLINTAAHGETTSTPSIDKRQARQEKRIQQGVESGQLTQKEAAKLDQEQQRIQHAEDSAKADGKVTRKEKKKFHRMQDKASKDIYRKKHNTRSDSN